MVAIDSPAFALAPPTAFHVICSAKIMWNTLKVGFKKIYFGPILLDLATVLVPIGAWCAAEARLGRTAWSRLASEADTALAAVIWFLLAAGRTLKVATSTIHDRKKKEAMTIMVFVLLGVIGSSFLYYDALVSAGAGLPKTNELGFIKARTYAAYIALGTYMIMSIRSEYHEVIQAGVKQPNFEGSAAPERAAGPRLNKPVSSKD